MKIKSAFFLLSLVMATNVHALPVIGNADVTDATLSGQTADGIAFSTANGQAGPNGNPSVFNGVFGGTWDLLGKVDSSGNFNSVVSNIAGSALNLGFTLGADQKSGVWSITSSKNLLLDLVLGIHAGGATASFLFDDTHLVGGQTQNGTFKIDWFNNGGNVPAYSNLTEFYGGVQVIPVVSAVPEPATYLMMLAGLGLMGLLAQRKIKHDN